MEEFIKKNLPLLWLGASPRICMGLCKRLILLFLNYYQLSFHQRFQRKQQLGQYHNNHHRKQINTSKNPSNLHHQPTFTP